MLDRPINIIGGDDRDLYLSSLLRNKGYSVTLWGFDKAGYEGFDLEKLFKRVNHEKDPIFIFPMSGIKENGEVRNKYSLKPIVINELFFSGIPKASFIMIGFATVWFRNLCQKHQIDILEMGEDDELAILNSIPSAEGAIQMAMENSKITIHSSASLVIGLGRCGLTLARMLKGLDSNVYVYARNNIALARAYEMGFIPVKYHLLEETLQKMNYIFNTAPALVLPKEKLDYCRKCEVIIDISSAPGGVDFMYAEHLGIKAILAPGLPGIVAPNTAAEMLASVYPKYFGRR